MFEQMKLLGAISGLMKNKDKLQAAAERVRNRLETLRVTGEGGAGAVRAVATGTLRVESVELAPSLSAALASDGARTHAESLIAEAVNDAVTKAQQRAREIISAELDELGLGDLGLASGGGGLLDSLGGLVR